MQKRQPISENAYKYLKKNNFIEGRKGNCYLSYKVIEPTKDKGLLAEYVSNRSFDDAYFKDLIIEFIKKGGKVKRKDIDGLIIPKLSAVLSESQKKYKVGNFLSSLRNLGKIENVGFGEWQIKADI